MLLFYTALIDDEQEEFRFEEIYHGYRRQMLYVAQGILRNPMDAEDAVQTALLGIARQIRRIPSHDPKILRAYVLTAAKNAALNMLPKKQRQDELLDISELDMANDQDLFEQVAASENYELLRRAMGKLPDVYRDVLMLKYVQELSMKEIASLLDRKTATVHQQIARGKKLLIAQCREEGMEIA